MSAFLGPIHHWLYKKILLQDNLTSELLATYDKSGIAEELSAKYGELGSEPLENIIDGMNIHGWLQQRVSLVESRLAHTVTALLSRGLADISDLERLTFAFGKAKQPGAIESAKDWYACLNNTLLDGMPCDRINEVQADTDDEVSWRRTQCIHREYWDAVGGDADNYYRLRDALITGMLDGSSFSYEKSGDNMFRLYRR